MSPDAGSGTVWVAAPGVPPPPSPGVEVVRAADGRPATVLGALLCRLVADPATLVVVLTGAVVEETATAFGAQCTGPTPRPRPTASVRMEPALLVHGFARDTGWAGRLVCLSGSGQTLGDAARLARQRPGTTHAVIAELRRHEDGWVALGSTVPPRGDSRPIAVGAAPPAATSVASAPRGAR